MSETQPNILVAKNIHKRYSSDVLEVPVLKGVDLTVRQGEFLAVVGASGSGKSTLLHILSTIDTPTSGRVTFEGEDIFAQTSVYRDELRNSRFGFVFQFYHLLPELTVLENVLMPLLVGSTVVRWLSRADRAEQAALALLEQFGLSHRVQHLPNQLSGGECQRVSIARAIIMEPAILFADEPTGNLDSTTGQQIFEILLGLHERGQTILMVTHDQSLARRADRILRLQDGVIVEQTGTKAAQGD